MAPLFVGGDPLAIAQETKNRLEMESPVKRQREDVSVLGSDMPPAKRQKSDTIQKPKPKSRKGNPGKPKPKRKPKMKPTLINWISVLPKSELVGTLDELGCFGEESNVTDLRNELLGTINALSGKYKAEVRKNIRESAEGIIARREEIRQNRTLYHKHKALLQQWCVEFMHDAHEAGLQKLKSKTRDEWERELKPLFQHLPFDCTPRIHDIIRSGRQREIISLLTPTLQEDRSTVYTLSLPFVCGTNCLRSAFGAIEGFSYCSCESRILKVNLYWKTGHLPGTVHGFYLEVRGGGGTSASSTTTSTSKQSQTVLQEVWSRGGPTTTTRTEIDFHSPWELALKGTVALPPQYMDTRQWKVLIPGVCFQLISCLRDILPSTVVSIVVDYDEQATTIARTCENTTAVMYRLPPQSQDGETRTAKEMGKRGTHNSKRKNKTT